MEVLPVTLQYHLMFWKNTSCLLLHLVQKWTHCFRFVNHLMYCWFWRKWNTRKLYSKFCMTIFIWFIHYVVFHNENPLYWTVLYTHKPKKCALHSASPICYRQQLKLECEGRHPWCSVLYTRWWTGGVWVLWWPLNLLCVWVHISLFFLKEHVMFAVVPIQQCTLYEICSWFDALLISKKLKFGETI